MPSRIKTRDVEDIQLTLGEKTGDATFRITHADGQTTTFELERDRAESMADMIEDSYAQWDSEYGGKDGV